MRPEPDAPGEFTPTEPETPRTNPALPATEQSQGIKPYRGGYYWLPTPSPDGITWSVVSCRDLGCGTDAGHDADLWPRLMVPLAKAWGKDAEVLRRRLTLFYTGRRTAHTAPHRPLVRTGDGLAARAAPLANPSVT